MKPIKGDALKVFTADEKKLMAEYLQDHWQLGTPLTETEFGLDIQHFVIANNFDTPFTNGIPDNALFVLT